MYKHILIPVSFGGDRDFSEIVEIAKALAAPDAKMTLLHVFEPLPGYYARYLPEDALSLNRKKVADDMATLAKTCDGTVEMCEGHAGREISRWANESDADCIVIASHQPAMSDILIGSTAQYVVRHAKTAVHVLR